MRRFFSKLRHTAMIAAAGAAAAYLLDPVNGSTRRAEIVDRVRTITGSVPIEPDARTDDPDRLDDVGRRPDTPSAGLQAALVGGEAVHADVPRATVTP